MYISTRNKKITSKDTLCVINGLSPDGGLFFPENLDEIRLDYKELVFLSEREISATILQKFLPSFSKAEMASLIEKAYDGKFEGGEIAPTKKVGNFTVTELFHGPTCAFKDVALSVLPHILTACLEKEGIKDKVMILTATSGDTGKAALEGFKDVPQTSITVFYPHGKVSNIQRMQMVSQEGKNVSVCAIKGNFDDAQTGVKKIFAAEEIDGTFKKSGIILSSANSINIARLCPQIMYYFKSYGDLCKNGEISLGDKVNFSVPTGNFGNILAGYIAYKLGLPVAKFICASNENCVLTDFINTGIYDKRREFIKTASPSMDILVSSNLERLLYLVSGDTDEVKGYMDSLSEKGFYKITDKTLSNIREMFCGIKESDAECFKTIKETYENENYLLDTHTSVAFGAAKKFEKSGENPYKTIVISTASPYKFAVSVSDAIGISHGNDEFETMELLSEKTATVIPKPLSSLKEKRELHTAVREINEMTEFVEERCKKI